MCDEPNRAGDERLTGDMDRLPHSLAALGSSSHSVRFRRAWEAKDRGRDEKGTSDTTEGSNE